MALPVILFLDECCNKIYDPHVLATEALGGTEATVVRIAEGLAKTGLFEVYVEQHCRSEDRSDFHARYVPPDRVHDPDYVISLRLPQTLGKAKVRFPKAKHYLWNHDLMGPDFSRDLIALSGFEAIAVSNFHKTQMQEQLKPMGYSIDRHFPIRVLYNPIDDDLQPDDTPVDRNKLVFFSSPHKGLEYTLEVFKNLRSFNSEFCLYVANPGYYPDAGGNLCGLRNLGALRHESIIGHVRSSLCVFYPNTVFPETFGLVFAEADAVGTPVITHNMGAASEVLFHPYEYLDCRNPKAVIERVMSWYNGDRPRVKARKEFWLSSVIKNWIRMLQG